MRFEEAMRIIATFETSLATIVDDAADGGRFTAHDLHPNQSYKSLFKQGDVFLLFNEKTAIYLNPEQLGAYVCLHNGILTWLYEEEVKIIVD